ncbi:hypothetical protein [Variovorax sp. V15]|uniref:hypothetical protein n=1 Tax=unclassified Variovorax TaxID=663243 RepID=UPI0034E8EDF4
MTSSATKSAAVACVAAVPILAPSGSENTVSDSRNERELGMAGERLHQDLAFEVAAKWIRRYHRQLSGE